MYSDFIKSIFSAITSIIFRKRIDWNKDTFDIIIGVSKEMKETKPNPLVVGAGRMAIFKGASVSSEEFERLVKMRDPAKAIDLFSKSYEVINFSSGYFKWKVNIFQIIGSLTLYAIIFILSTVLAIFNFIIFRDCLMPTQGCLKEVFLLFCWLLMATLSLFIFLHEFYIIKKGKEFLMAQIEDFAVPLEITNPNASSHIPTSEDPQADFAQTSVHKQNTVSNKICIRVSL